MPNTSGPLGGTPIGVKPTQVVAVVNKPLYSKINWAQIVGAVAVGGAMFIPGFHLDPAVQTEIVGGLGLATMGVTWLLRTFGHAKAPASSTF